MIMTARLLFLVASLAAAVSSLAVTEMKVHDNSIVVHNSLALLRDVRNRVIDNKLYPPSECQVMRLYRPTAQCVDIDRYGNLGDGGKWVCGTHTILDHRRVIYSIGSDLDTSFELNMHTQDPDADIHTFDHTVDAEHENVKNRA